MRRSKSKLEKKVAGGKRVLKFKPLVDSDGRRYISFCDYGWHQGMIKYPLKCEQRNCNHYYKFYLKL